MNHQSTRISSVRMSTLITLNRVCGFPAFSFRSSFEVSTVLFRSTDEDDAHRRIPDGDNQIVIRSERPTEGERERKGRYFPRRADDIRQSSSFSSTYLA